MNRLTDINSLLPERQSGSSHWDDWGIKLHLQRRMIIIVLAFLALYCAFIGVAEWLKGGYWGAGLLLSLSVLNGGLAVWHRRYRGGGHSSAFSTGLNAIGLVLLFFYLLVNGGSQGGNMLWAMSLAPAMFFLLGHRWGLIVFSSALLLTALMFYIPINFELQLGNVLGENPGDIKARFLSVLTLIGFYSFVLEYDRARVVGSLLRNQRVLARLASTDELTGLANRRTMSELLDLQERRCRQQHESYGLILGDIDHFKQINDSYGHDCGDLVITEVANAIQAALRDHDVVARWGGEEFLVVLPDTDLPGAMNVAVKLREAIAGLSLNYDGHLIQSTMSFGVVCGGHRVEIKERIKQADHCLYQAKHNGRNCIVHD